MVNEKWSMVNALNCLQLKGHVRTRSIQGWYFTDGSTQASAWASKPPSYPTHVYPWLNVKL